MAAILSGLGLLCACQPQPVADFTSLDSFFESHMTEHRIPGLTAAILTPDSTLWQQSYGYADLDRKIPMTARHIQNIASVSKTFTSTAVMQLWEQGKLDLEADINTYLPFSVRHPAFPEIPITLHHLLTHTSSISDGPAYGASYACGDPGVSLADWISGYLQVEGAYFDPEHNFLSDQPGTTREYSNVGYGLLGYIVAQVSGQSFSSYCQQHIFSPLGMTHTGWFLADIDTSMHAQTYMWQNPTQYERLASSELIPDLLPASDSGFVATCRYSFYNYPDGLLRTSVEDLSKYMKVWLNGGRYAGGQLLKPETIDLMLTPQLSDNLRQGLCWSYTGFEAVWGHGGNDPGVQTAFYFSREKGIGMIILQNADAGGRSEKLEQMYQAGIRAVREAQL
ncbi:MAG: serine hydrolase domain-containing protein [Bacteroidota bacterium]